MEKLTVLIVGATGHTGSSIVDALLKRPNFYVIALVRPSSVLKPDVAALQDRGVEIRIADLEHSLPEQLIESLKGADVVLYTTHDIKLQYSLIDAAKKVGVKRFIPNDWSPACTRGVRTIYDEKLAVHDYIKEAGIGYTFIDMGWWFILPAIDSSRGNGLGPFIDAYSREIDGTGDVKSAIIDRRDIGEFVARILLDERTLNRYVFCYGEEVTQNGVLALAERISGKKIDPTKVRKEEIIEQLKTAQGPMRTMIEYKYSGWIRGDNTVENAKKEEYGGALDAKELYPDINVRTLEAYAKEFYQ